MLRSLLFFCSLLFALTAEAAIVYEQPLDPSGALHQSSFVVGDTDADTYTWENFTLASTADITEVRWYGGYIYDALYGKAQAFKIRFWATSIANEPDVVHAALKAYTVNGNASETPTAYTGIYEYRYVLPSTFTAQAGVKYWIQIVAAQPWPDWGLAHSQTGDGNYFRYIVGGHMYQWISGNMAFSLSTADAANYTMSVSADPPAGGTVTGSGTYANGTKATLKAIPNAGYVFKNWTEGSNILGTSATYSCTMTANHTVVGNFTVKVAGLAIKPRSFTGGRAATVTVTIAAPAPDGCKVDITNESYGFVQTPPWVLFGAGDTTATFDVASYATSVDIPVKLTATSGKSTLSITFTLRAPVMSTFAIKPKAPTGGRTAIGTITLDGIAPQTDFSVTLSTDNAAVTLPNPETVWISRGTNTVSFNLVTSPVAVDTAATITATHGTTTKTAVVTVKAPVLAIFNLKTATVVGGTKTAGVVTLSGLAPIGGITVSLASNNAAATVPPSVVVAAGTRTAKFPIVTKAVGVNTPVTITTTATNVLTKVLTVTP